MDDILAKIIGGTMLIATVVTFLHNPLPIMYIAAVLLAIAYLINPRI